jgi:hypothetical protein
MMPRGRKADIFGSIRAQAAKVLQQLERQIATLEGELAQLVEQSNTWRNLIGGRRQQASRGPGRPGRPGRPRGQGARRSGGKRVDWNEVLASVPRRFGVQDVMRHPGAASKGRAQVYPALSRWESAKLIRRVSQGVYEKAGGGNEGGTETARTKPAGKRTGGRRVSGAKRAAKRGPRAKAAEAKS